MTTDLTIPQDRPNRGTLWVRMLVVIWSVWWGGITFYAAIVIPIGTELVGTIEQGLITQRVTIWHNRLTAVLLLLLLPVAYQRRHHLVWIGLGVLVLVSLGLLIQHNRLTGMVDFHHHTTARGFYRQHALYLWLTTVEWALGLVVPFYLLLGHPISSPAVTDSVSNTSADQMLTR